MAMHRWLMGGIVFAAGTLGCSDLVGHDQRLPAGTADPSSFNTLQGALGMGNAANLLFEQALEAYIVDAGLLTDELTEPNLGVNNGTIRNPIDERILPELSVTSGLNGNNDGASSYDQLQRARGGAMQALGALAAYGQSVSPAIRGELYALEGYTELLLADLFCSGVPLSTLDFQGDYTYHASSTTRQVYADAVAKFDTAIALSGDSIPILDLALIGKGRGLLALDSATAAAQIVSAVPDGFAFTLAVKWGEVGNNIVNRTGATVSDNEGGVGIPYQSSGDPRTAVVLGRTSLPANVPLYFPQKYSAGLSNSYAPIVVGGWIEARLIQAEAALRAKDYGTWLAVLNTLRHTASVPGQTDTLTTLADPGDSHRDSARVALMFRERASWLFLDGHRQGDLRRLIRQYSWPQDEAYPSGLYLGPGLVEYGSDVTAPIPPDENPNPFFHGCLDRNE